LVARTPDQARASATPMPTGAPAPAGSTTSQSDYTQFLSVIAKSPALITGYSKLLKSAGYYKGKITDKYTPALQKAFTKAEEDRLSISTVRPMGRDEFLQETISLGGVGAGSGSGGPTSGVSKATRISNTTEAAALIESIIQDTLGRKATAAELKKYTASLQAAQKKAPTVTKYTSAGTSQTSQTTGGINEQQYLIDKISGTDEAKANKVLGFYETFMNALGGGR
jgi:hypothetical protein